ncbi:heme-binding protein [uncultured Mycobacterium sp.]|uniref:heme-binding protein n=1 Tax=uncultured Mycobacterium sp. TaxID=171292 RepID=UPI0035CB70E4
MKLSGMTMRRRAVGIAAASCVLGGLAATTLPAPSASAAPDCSPAAVNDTVSSATGQARQYLDAHPDANAAVTSAFSQPRPQAAATLRSYFTAHPQEYYDLRGILAPIGDTERQCNTTALSPELQSAYNEFMAG